MTVEVQQKKGQNRVVECLKVTEVMASVESKVSEILTKFS